MSDKPMTAKEVRQRAKAWSKAAQSDLDAIVAKVRDHFLEAIRQALK